MTRPPIACSLAVADRERRAALVAELVTDALVARERDAATLVLRFRTVEGVERRVRTLAALEAECCPFLAIAIDANASEVVLRIAAPPEAGAILEEFFPGAQ